MNAIKKILNNKLLFYIPLIIIMIISFLNMQNAKLLSSLYKYNLIKQILWYLLGFIILFIGKKININAILKYSVFLYILSNILLLLVLFIGKDINGAKAWFSIGPISFQPSEIGKITLTLLLCKILSQRNIKNIKDEIKFIITILIFTFIPSILVFLEPDTGAIIYYLLIAFTVLILAKIHKFWFIILFLCLLLGLGSFIVLYLFNQDLLINLIGTSFFYRVERIITFKTSNSYQLNNAIIAMGASSLLGSGLNNVSIYIPEAPTDFIFAFTISNFGIIAGFIVLLSYLLIDIYLINKFFYSKKTIEKYILLNFIVIFLFGQLVNISMNLGLLPIIGIPLPFLSYGGSTLIIYFIFLAIVL